MCGAWKVKGEFKVFVFSGGVADVDVFSLLFGPSVGTNRVSVDSLDTLLLSLFPRDSFLSRKRVSLWTSKSTAWSSVNKRSQANCRESSRLVSRKSLKKPIMDFKFLGMGGGCIRDFCRSGKTVKSFSEQGRN